MADHTLRSLFDFISANRQAREEDARALAQAPLAERPLRAAQIAQADQAYREEIQGLEGLSDLLAVVPRLQDGWPYPSEGVLDAARAELAHQARRSPQDFDALPLREVVAAVSGQRPSMNGTPAASLSTSEVPGKGVEALPRWARVAFAARCAARVVALLPEAVPQVSPDVIEGLERAVRLAEESASTAHTAPGTEDAARQATELAHRTGPRAMGQVGGANVLLGIAGSTAAVAAHAAVEEDPSLASGAYRRATLAGRVLGSTVLLEGMRRDFFDLAERARREGWNDQSPVPPTILPQPRIRVVGLSIRDLRAIRQFDLPRDGLGWREQVPDLMVLAGINGSGKTTLLNFLVAALELVTPTQIERVLPVLLLEEAEYELPARSSVLSEARQAWVEFEVEVYETKPVRFRVVVGDREFVAANSGTNRIVVLPRSGGGWGYSLEGDELRHLADWLSERDRRSTSPAVLYVPSEERTLVVPGEGYKAAGKLEASFPFVHRWRPPPAWKDSLEAFLYSLRWEDLNAREEGRFSDLGHFDAYASAFRMFTGDVKSLKFEQGKLVVKIAGSNVTHDLTELSSGEQQALLLTGEILRYWRPGSLILIDEPELHLHTRWQTQLYHALRYWQKERGGQVILSTQSAHLMELAGAGTAALLGLEPL